ncbi:MAG: putative transposase [Gammaproteobacteria bacterium]
MPDAASALTRAPLVPLIPRLDVLTVGDHRTVFLNGHLIARFPCGDRGTERVVVTQLAEVLPLADRAIATAFDLHPVTLSRFRGQLHHGGAAALMPRRTGPKGPSKMTARLAARCRQLRLEGRSVRDIAARVSRPGRTISHVTVAALVKTGLPAAEPTPQPLALEPGSFDTPTVTASARVTATEPASPLLAPESTPTGEAPAAPPPVAITEPRTSRYAGALLLCAALARLDLWGVFRRLAATVGPARQYGWAETVAAIVWGFALRFRSIEDLKNALRADLGVLLGTAQAPTVLALRQKIQALVESVDPAAVSRALFQRYVALEPVWEGFYYVDGHFCPYYGQHPTPKGWNPKRRLAIPGHTDVYIHDARGRALFFFSQPLNDSLGRALPTAVAEIRQAHGAGPFTLVFDRGGFSADAFRFLNAEGIGFITYLKGRKARRRFPTARFQPGWFAFERQRHVYRLFEKQTRVGRAGTMRTILFLGDEDQQIPVITNLAGAKPAKVIHCLRLRWRQENSFKFLTEHYAIDQIIQYGADPETQDRRVVNPKRKALKEELRRVTQDIQTLEAQLGRALEANEERRRPTARGVKIAHGRLRRTIAQRQQVLARLENRLRHTPGQIDAAAVGKTRSLLREDRRLVVNALKLAAYNAERLSALRFNQYYRSSKDVFSVFRALLHLPGEVRRTDGDRLEVCLQPPDSPKIAHALEALIGDLNQDQPRLFGDGPILHFTLSGVNMNGPAVEPPLSEF